MEKIGNFYFSFILETKFVIQVWISKDYTRSKKFHNANYQWSGFILDNNPNLVDQQTFELKNLFV